MLLSILPRSGKYKYNYSLPMLTILHVNNKFETFKLGGNIILNRRNNKLGARTLGARSRGSKNVTYIQQRRQ